MAKLSRVVFIIGLVFIAVGFGATAFTLTYGKQMIARVSADNSSNMQAALEKARGSIEKAESHLVEYCVMYVLGAAACVAGIIATLDTTKGTRFLILAAFALVAGVVLLFFRYWLVGLFCVGGAVIVYADKSKRRSTS